MRNNNEIKLFKQVWKKAGLIEGIDWQTDEEYGALISMSGMKKLRDYYFSVGVVERSRKAIQILGGRK